MTLISGMTEAGLELLAKSQTGKKIFFTRMKVGTGYISENTNYYYANSDINLINRNRKLLCVITKVIK